MKKLIAIKDMIIKIEGLICFVALGFMFLIGAMEVISRNMIKKSFYWSQEAIVIMLVWEVFMGAAYIFSTSNLIRVDVLYEKFNIQGRKVLDTVGSIIIVIISVIVLRYGFNYMLVQNRIKTTALGIPQSIFTIPMIISSASMILEVSCRFLERIFKLQLKKEGN